MCADPSYHILFVEDHEDTRLVMQLLLQSCGYGCTCAGTCAEAIELAGTRRFDLLIADIGMPDGDGLDLLACIRSMYPINGIALSAYGMPADIERARAAGFKRHLLKPVGPTTT